jgi:hypothetical protein
MANENCMLFLPSKVYTLPLREATAFHKNYTRFVFRGRDLRFCHASHFKNKEQINSWERADVEAGLHIRMREVFGSTPYGVTGHPDPLSLQALPPKSIPIHH